MKKTLALIFFLLIFIDLAKAQNFYNTTYLDWINLTVPQSPVKKASASIIFSREGKYWVIRPMIRNTTHFNVSVSRYDIWGNLEETRFSEYFDGNMIGFSSNYFTWDGNYYIIPSIVSNNLMFVTFNLTKYKDGMSGIEFMPYSLSISSTLVPIPSFTYHLTVGFGDSNFNNPPIAYRGTDNRIHILYNFFDLVDNSWHWDSRKDIMIDTGITYIKQGFVYPSSGGCRVHSNCFLLFFYEGNSSQNANRYGIYLREIYKGTFGLEFYDIPLISTTTWGCNNFDYCYDGNITYWRIGSHKFEANRILIRLLKPDKTYEYFFFAFNPYNFYKEADIKINVKGSNAIAPYARVLNVTFIKRESNIDYFNFLNLTNITEKRVWFKTGLQITTGTTGAIFVNFIDAYNSSINFTKRIAYASWPPTGQMEFLDYIDVEPNRIYNITLYAYSATPYYFQDMDVFSTPRVIPLPFDTQLMVGEDAYYYQEAFFVQYSTGVVSDPYEGIMVQPVALPYYVPTAKKITKTCEYINTYPSNTYFACDIDDISIPSNAINIRAKTSAKVSVINGTFNSPDKTFEIKACSPRAGVGEDGEKCRIEFLRCTEEDARTEITKYRTGLPGTTITSNVHANISEGCISGTGFPIWVKITGKTEVEYDTISLTEKRVEINVEPESGNETTIFKIYLSTYNLAYPYTPILVVDGEEFTLSPKNQQNIELDYNFYGKPGIHLVYWKVVDSAGWQGITANKTITVYGVGVAPFTLSVMPEEGNAMTSFRFSTSRIYNGTPPYYVVVFPVKYGEDARIGSCSLPSSGVCSFSTILPCGNESYMAKATDSAGSVSFSNMVTPRVLCEALGNPLNLTLEVDPKTGDTQTIFTFTLRVDGGKPPYYASWEDWGNMMCYETYTSEPPFTVERRYKLWSGSRGIDVHITSADGQRDRSNKVLLEVKWAGEPSSIAYDCTGTLGTGYSREALAPSYQQPLINQSALVSVGAGWMGAFFTPIFISTIMLLGISGLITLSVAKYSGGDLKASGAIFLGCVVLLSIIYSISGIYPSWLVLVFIIIAGFIFAKFIIGVI